MRGWSDGNQEDDEQELFAGGPGSGGSDGAGASGRARIAMAAISSIAAKIGCTAETLRLWVRRTERDQGKRAGLTTDERERLKALER